MSDPNLPPVGPQPSQYDQINSTLNGLPDLLVKVAQSPTYQKMQAQRQSAASGGGIWDSLGKPPVMAPSQNQTQSQPDTSGPFGAIAHGIANSGSFGIMDAMLRRARPDVYAGQQAQATKYPGAEMAGEIGGSLIPTPGNIAGEALRGGKLGANLLRAGIGAASQALPRAAVTAADTGDVGKAAIEGGVGTVLGTGLGLAGQKIAQAIPNALSETQRGLRGIINSAFVNFRLLKKAGSFGPKAQNPFLRGQNEEALSQEVSNILGENHINTVDDLGKHLEDEDNIYKQVKSAYNTSANGQAPKLGDLIDPTKGSQFMDRPDVQKAMGILNKPSEYKPPLETVAGAPTPGQHALGVLVNDADLEGNYGGAQESLNDAISSGFKANTRESRANAYLAMALKNHMDEHAQGALDDLAAQAKTGDPTISVPDMKRRYAAEKLLAEGYANRLAHEEPAFIGGPNTAPKLASMAAMAGLTGGAATVPSIVGGTLLGDVVNRGAAKIGNAVARVGARGALKVLPSAEGPVSQTMQALSRYAPQRIGGAMPGILNQNSDQSVGQVAPMGPPVNPLTPAPVGTTDTPENQATLGAIQQKEAGLSPQKQQEASQQMNAQFNQQIMSKLQMDYNTRWKYLPEYSGPQGFQKLVGDMQTMAGDGQGGFDPKRAAGILYQDPDQRSQFLRSYSALLTLKNINTSAALSTPIERLGSGVGGFLSGGGRAAGAQIGAATDALKQMMASAASAQDPKISSKEAMDQASEDLKNIQLQRGDQQSKYALLLRTLNSKYGLTLDILKEMGLQ